MIRKQIFRKTIIAGAISALFSYQAYATNVNIDDPSGEGTLQNLLDDITEGTAINPLGDSSIGINEAQVGADSWWSLTSTGSSASTLVAEISGYMGSNALGIYDASDPSRSVTLFEGGDNAGKGSSFTLYDTDGSGSDFQVYVNNAYTGVDFADNLFGFFLDTPEGTWYSDSRLNSDAADHLVAYSGNNSDALALPLRAAGIWTDNEFLLAWEDKAYPDWDYDYNDFVTMVESVVPVPEPSSLLLFGVGLMALGAMSRRKKQHS